MVSRMYNDDTHAQDAGGPLCLRFWTHMFGHGVGSLNVYVRAGDKDRKIWGLTGDAGNNWYMGQAPIASTDNFRVSMEDSLTGYVLYEVHRN